MSETVKPTEGRWAIQTGKTAGREIIAPHAPKTRRVVARFGGPDRAANANLCVAAKDMYENGNALADQIAAVIHQLDGQAYSSTLSALLDFKAALLRAEGKS